MSGINPFITHVSGGRKFIYPAAGGKRPPGGAKVHILTIGGVCVDAQWSDDPDKGFLGWAPLPMRDRVQEGRVIAAWKALKSSTTIKG